MPKQDSITFHGDELQTLCEWFGVVRDLNPAYLEKKDFLLACRLYVCANRRVTNEMREKIGLWKYEDETGFDPADHPDAGGPAGR